MSDEERLDDELDLDDESVNSEEGPEEEEQVEGEKKKTSPALRAWMAQLPDKYKQHNGLAQFANIGELAEDWEEMRTRLEELEEAQALAPEIPESPEDYQVEIPRVPASMSGREYAAYRKDLATYLEATAEEIKQLCHGLKLPAEAAQKVAELFAAKHYEAVQTAIDHQAIEREKGLDALKRQWGGDFAARQELARRAVQTFGGQDLAARVEAAGFGSDPLMLELFSRIGKAIGEHHMVPGRPMPTQPAGRPGTPATGGRDSESLKRRYNKSPELHS